MQPPVQHPVSQTIEKHLKRYLDDLGDTAPSNVYQMVLTVMEKPVPCLLYTSDAADE